MRKFYIGQMVKVVRATNYPEYLGREMVVVGYAPDYFSVPAYQLANVAPYAEEYCLEPILLEGLESGEDINALYEPQITEADIPSEVWQR